MPQSKRFELCFRFSNPFQVSRKGDRPDIQEVLFDSKEYKVSAPLTNTDIGDIFHTRIRAFDTQSYFLCRLLVKRGAFGFINQKHFFFIEVNDGSEHGLKSKTVQEACKASEEFVGTCFRVRETLRT